MDGPIRLAQRGDTQPSPFTRRVTQSRLNIGEPPSSHDREEENKQGRHGGSRFHNCCSLLGLPCFSLYHGLGHFLEVRFPLPDRNYDGQPNTPQQYEDAVSFRYSGEVGQQCCFDQELSNYYLFITLDALLNTPTTAEVIFGAETAMAIAIKASMMAYSTTVTPACDFFRRLLGAIRFFISNGSPYRNGISPIGRLRRLRRPGNTTGGCHRLKWSKGDGLPI